MKKILFSAMMIALSLAACNRIDVNTETPAGTGSLSFTVTDLTDYVTIETKSGIDYTDYTNYDVVIEGPTPVSGKYGEMFLGNVVELGSGSYTITVTSPATEPAAFDQPIYRAYEEFEIKAGEVTDLKLICTPYNCKVTIELSDNFKKELASYEVVVTNGLGELVWTKNAEKDDFAAGKAGYFLARGLEVKVKGFRSIDNTEATAVYFVKNPQPAEHHIIRLDAKVTGEIGGITIDVVTTFKEEHDDIYVDGMDESYVDRPDFDGSEGEDEEEVKPANSIVWEGNETFEELDFMNSLTDSEKSLLKNVSVYLVGHHGSKYSSSDMLLDLITPLFNVISVDENNSYGFPRYEVIERLEKHKRIDDYLIMTSSCGNVSFGKSDGYKRRRVNDFLVYTWKYYIYFCFICSDICESKKDRN